MASRLHSRALELCRTCATAPLASGAAEARECRVLRSQCKAFSKETGVRWSSKEAKIKPTSKAGPRSTRPKNLKFSCPAASVDASVSSDLSSTTGIGFEERKRAAEEDEASKPYRVTETETIGQQEFNPAKVIAVQQVAPGVKCVTVDAEVSREFVALENAYTKPGQSVRVKLPNGDVAKVFSSSAPIPSEANAKVLLKLRGDIPAGTTKLPQFSLSVKMPLDLHIPESSPLHSLQPGDELSIGPFEGGLDLRPILFLSRFPKILIFAEGEGISAARSILEAKDVGSLYLNMRQDVRLYYSAAKPSDLAYQNLHEEWSKKVNFRPTVNSKEGENWDGFVGSFSELFDEDDLEYDPETTAAVVCVRSSQKESVVALLNEAGIDMKQVIFADY